MEQNDAQSGPLEFKGFHLCFSSPSPLVEAIAARSSLLSDKMWRLRQELKAKDEHFIEPEGVGDMEDRTKEDNCVTRMAALNLTSSSSSIQEGSRSSRGFKAKASKEPTPTTKNATAVNSFSMRDINQSFQMRIERWQVDKWKLEGPKFRKIPLKERLCKCGGVGRPSSTTACSSHPSSLPSGFPKANEDRWIKQEKPLPPDVRANVPKPDPPTSQVSALSSPVFKSETSSCTVHCSPARCTVVIKVLLFEQSSDMHHECCRRARQQSRLA